MTDYRFHNREMETLSRDELDALQLRRLREMLAHVANTNPFYASHWKAAGIDVSKVASLEDFRLVPMVEKADFVADQNAHPPYGTRMGSFNQNLGRADIYTTSGTSGQGKELHACSLRELRAMEELYRYGFTWAGMHPGDSVLLTLPLTMLAGGRVEYQGAVGAEMTVLPVGNYDAASKIDHIRRFRPRALYGSTSYFGHLAALMGEDAKTNGVEVLLTGMEGAGLSFLKSIEDMWGAKAYDRFGCAQIRADFMFSDETGVGTPGQPGVLMNLDPFLLVEVIDPATGLPVGDGEFGEIVVTSLYHFDNPAIRNRLRDGGVFRRGGRPGAVRNFHGIEVASIGRIDDVRKVKGINIYPQAIDDLVFSWPEVEQYEVVLTRTLDFSDVATLRLQLRTSASGIPIETFIHKAGKAIKERIGVNFALEIVGALDVSDYKAKRWIDLR